MFATFRRHLHSTAGEAGLADLASKAEGHLPSLRETWRARDGDEGISPFGVALMEAIAALDSFDLRPAQVRLRPASSGQVPVGVISKLTRALVEYLANGDARAEREALKSLTASGPAQLRFEFERGFRAALAELLIEQSSYDLAIETIDGNLLVQHDSYSEHLLYRALSKLKQAGLISGSTRLGLEDLSDRFCEQPFESISTTNPSWLGKHNKEPGLFACSCAGMLPYPIANSDGRAGSQDYWNGPEIQELRRSILDGDYTYCSRMLCPRTLDATLQKKDDVSDPVMRDIIDNNRVRIETPPRSILVAHDETCNLACPSCRSKLLSIRNDAREKLDAFADRVVLPLIRDAEVVLHVAGDGEIFASRHYRKLVRSLDPVQHRGVKLYLHSNGLLFTPEEWEALAEIRPLIQGAAISIDAAEPATYEDVRRPGKWETLTANMDFVAGLRRAGKLSYLALCFVVQKKNFEEMPAFVELARGWATDQIFFSRIFPTIHPTETTSAEFVANAVADERHPDHRRFLDVLKHPILKSKEVNLFNIGVR